MFGKPWRIATIRGVPVNVDPSWVWIAVLITYSLWTRFDTFHPDLSAMGALALAIVGASLFFGAVFLHEGAHAVAARWNGIEVHGITLVLFGGFTSARSDSKGPGAAFVIAAVGPATSLVLGAAFWGLFLLLRDTNAALAAMFGYIGWVNLFMAVFNVLPGLPLDGGRMLQSAVWRLTGTQERGTKIAAWTGMGIGVLLLGLAVVAVAQNDVGSAVWSAIIGLFIFQGARSAGQQIDLARRISKATVADAMDPPPPAIPAEISLSEALDRFLRGHEEEAFPVVEDGRVIGMLSFSSSRELGIQDPLRPARDAVIPLGQVLTAHPDEPLDDVSARLGSSRAALVLRDGVLVGAITGHGVYRWALSAGR
jgi:Zn-dependent protease